MTGLAPAWLRGLAQDCWRQPLSQAVPDDAGFAHRKSLASLLVRSLRRRLQLRLSSQQALRHERLQPGWTRLLWLHQGMPQIGDALMDLAPRSLLVEAGYQVDLLAPPHLAALFADDPWFGRVLALPPAAGAKPAYAAYAAHAANAANAAPAAQDYDAVILLSDDRRSLQFKRQHLAGLPWLSMHGLYNGPDFHRARFSAQRHADWLGLHLPAAALAHHARQKLALAPAAAQWAQQQTSASGAVLLALGGVVAERSYSHWPAVVAALRPLGLRQWVLVGSANGRSAADAVRAAAQPGDQVLDLVGRTSLQQVHALAAQARAVLGCDGGLMHLALCTQTPVLGLFSADIQPAWRLPVGQEGHSLQAPTRNISSLDPAQVAKALQRLLASAASGRLSAAANP